MRAEGVPPVKYAIPTKIKDSQLRPAYAPTTAKKFTGSIIGAKKKK